MVEDLVNRYRMSVSQMTTYIFRLSKSFFPLPRPNTRFVTRKTRWVPLVAQELLTPPEGLITVPVFCCSNFNFSRPVFGFLWCFFVSIVFSVPRFPASD
jgi:hypothetical protein